MTCSFCDATGGDIWLKNCLNSTTRCPLYGCWQWQYNMQCGHGLWPGAGWSCSSHMAAVTSHDNSQAGATEPGVSCIHYFAVVLTQKHVDMWHDNRSIGYSIVVWLSDTPLAISAHMHRLKCRCDIEVYELESCKLTSLSQFFQDNYM